MNHNPLASVRNLLGDGHTLQAGQIDLLNRVATHASELGLPLYVVGGFVRDALIGRQVNDFDIVVEGSATKLSRALANRHGGRVVMHAAFHTATWFPASETLGGIDLISARSETYAYPAALPTVKLGTIGDDLHRRDFTINAMAVRLDGEHFGELLDPLNGQADLKKGLMRVLHPRSFIDDPTRIFRIVRYAGRYGFKITPETLSLLPEALHYVDKLTPERLRHELDLIFEEENAASMLERLGDMEVFSAVKPALPLFDPMRARWLQHSPPADFDVHVSPVMLGYLLWLMDLPEKNIVTLASRLDFTADLTRSLRAAAHLKSDLSHLEGSAPSRWVERLDKFPPTAIYIVQLVTQQEALKEYLLKWRHIKAVTTGIDLQARGLPPGPVYKKILSALRAAWLDGEVKSFEEEAHLLESLL